MKYFLIFLFSTSTLLAQKPQYVTAELKEAAVYFDGVELTHNFTVNLPAGTSEIVIKNVADQINENTIQVAASKDISVLSTQFTTSYDAEYDLDDSNPKIKQIKDSIEYLEMKILSLKNQQQSIHKTIELLDKNQTVYGVNSGLNLEELKKMVVYYQDKRTALSDELNALQKEEVRTQKKLADVRAKLDWNQINETNISKGKLVMLVMSKTPAKVEFAVNYYTNKANWRPFYDLKIVNTSSPIQLLYKAGISQTTGLDWKNVKLSLSSGTPNQSNQAPTLSAWFLRFRQNVQAMGYNNSNIVRNNIVVKEDSNTHNEALTLGSSVQINENQLSTSFDIDVPYDILSNGKIHSVSMTELQLPASYSHYAVPKLDNNAYLLASIKDYSQYNLLQGEANIILENRYVGKTYINPNATSDTLQLSIGKDKRIRVKREKITDKSGTKFLSAYKEQTFTYDITIRNNKKESINLLLKDQFPLSTDTTISVEWQESSKGEVNKETGVINWYLKIKPGETVTKRIRYLVKYPKDSFIGNL